MFISQGAIVIQKDESIDIYNHGATPVAINYTGTPMYDGSDSVDFHYLQSQCVPLLPA